MTPLGIILYQPLSHSLCLGSADLIPGPGLHQASPILHILQSLSQFLECFLLISLQRALSFHLGFSSDITSVNCPSGYSMKVFPTLYHITLIYFPLNIYIWFTLFIYSLEYKFHAGRLFLVYFVYCYNLRT